MELLLRLFLVFFKIGAFTFGGGYAMIPMIKTEVIENGWLDLSALVDFIAISESTPGPFAVNIATFIGMSQAGLLGAFIATLGVILPSFIIILIIAKFFMSFKDNFYVKSTLYGLRPTVVGLIISATFSIALSSFFGHSDTNLTLDVLFSSTNWIAILIFAILFALNKFKKIHPIAMILLSAIMGIVFYSMVGMIA